MTFADKRKRAGFKTQQSLADFLGVSLGAVKSWENKATTYQPHPCAVKVLNAMINDVDRSVFDEKDDI